MSNCLPYLPNKSIIILYPIIGHSHGLPATHTHNFLPIVSINGGYLVNNYIFIIINNHACQHNLQKAYTLYKGKCTK